MAGGCHHHGLAGKAERDPPDQKTGSAMVIGDVDRMNRDPNLLKNAILATRTEPQSRKSREDEVY